MARKKATARPEETDQTNILNLPTPGAATPTVQLATPAHYGLVRRACTAEAVKLTKLAKDTSAAGYAKASREVLADAKALTEDIEPAFRSQGVLDLASQGDVRSQVMAHLRHPIDTRISLAQKQGADLADKKREQPARVDHGTRLLEDIADRVVAFALRITEDAYQAGLRARQDTAATFALRGIEALRTAQVPAEAP